MIATLTIAPIAVIATIIFLIFLFPPIYLRFRVLKCYDYTCQVGQMIAAAYAGEESPGFIGQDAG